MERLSTATLSVLLLTALLLSSVPAQIGIGRIKTDNLPGDAVLPPGAINITAIAIANLGNDGTGLDDSHGVARLPNGHYIISMGQPTAVSFSFPPAIEVPDRHYFEFDASGNFLGSVLQPDPLGAQSRQNYKQNLGLTDLAWDRETDASSRLWAGRGRRIMSYDWQAQAFDDVIMPGSANGMHFLEAYSGDWIQAATIADIDGKKIFISADSIRNEFGPAPQVHSRINYHIMGLPLADFPRLKDPTRFHVGPLDRRDFGKLGTAYDPTRGTVWWGIDWHTNNPNPNRSAVRFIEMDLDGNMTGQVVQGIREIGGVARGCEMYIDANGNAVMAYVVSLDPLGIGPSGNSGEDILVEMYMGFQYGSSCGGDIAFETEPYIGNLDWTITLENAGSNPLGVAFLALGNPTALPGFTIPGVTNCGVLLELSSLVSQGLLPLVHGEASFIRTLPDLPSLVGIEAAFQWLMPSASGGLPLNLSDAGAFRVGTNL